MAEATDLADNLHIQVEAVVSLVVAVHSSSSSPAVSHPPLLPTRYQPPLESGSLTAEKLLDSRWEMQRHWDLGELSVTVSNGKELSCIEEYSHVIYG